MTFTQAALIVVALGAIALALVCYHLLGRLDTLEQAVQGGLTPPSRRLTRQEFEQRFARALARRRLAAQVGTGLVLVVGSEFVDGELHGVLGQLGRGDGLTIVATHASANAAVEHLGLAGSTVLDALPEGAGVGITPYVFVIDQGAVRSERPVASADDLLQVLRHAT